MANDLIELLRRPYGNLTFGEREQVASTIEALQAEKERLRKTIEKLCVASIPMFTDEAGLVHFETHPKAIDLWSEVADARAALQQDKEGE